MYDFGSCKICRPAVICSTNGGLDLLKLLGFCFQYILFRLEAKQLQVVYRGLFWWRGCAFECLGVVCLFVCVCVLLLFLMLLVVFLLLVVADYFRTLPERSVHTIPYRRDPASLLSEGFQCNILVLSFHVFSQTCFCCFYLLMQLPLLIAWQVQAKLHSLDA